MLLLVNDVVVRCWHPVVRVAGPEGCRGTDQTSSAGAWKCCQSTFRQNAMEDKKELTLQKKYLYF